MVNALPLFILLHLSTNIGAVWHVYRTYNVSMLEDECRKLKNYTKPYRRTTIEPKMYQSNSISSGWSENRFFMCHSSVNSSLMQFRTEHGLPYTEFHKVWKNVEAHRLSCGVGVIFKPILTCQNNVRYLCSVLYNGSLLNYSDVKTRQGKYRKIKTVELLNNKIRKGSINISMFMGYPTHTLTCKVVKINGHYNSSQVDIRFKYRNKAGNISTIENSTHPIVVAKQYGLLNISRNITFHLLEDTGVIICEVYYIPCGLASSNSYQISKVDLPANIGPPDETDDFILVGTLSGTFLIAVIVTSLLIFKKKLARFMGRSSLLTSTESDVSLPENNGPANINHYDVFICYSSKDREWVKEYLLHGLEERHVEACIDYRDFHVGAYISENINDAIYHSRMTIAVLSPDFLESVYCKSELKTALMRKEDHTVVSVLYQSCAVPEILKNNTIELNSSSFWVDLILLIKQQ